MPTVAPSPLEALPGLPGSRAPRAYTAHDTASLRDRIGRDLARVVAEVRRADPGLRALVLTGGFARGEGSCHRGAPLNDYDLVALRSATSRPERGYGDVRADLERELGLHIDLAPVRLARLRWVRPSVFWYETAMRGHVLWGDPGVLGRIPVRSASQVPPVEGVRLLANRAAGLLMVDPAAAQAREHGTLAVRIQACKALLAALDAGLLAAGRFAPTQRERWQLHQHLHNGQQTTVGDLPDGEGDGPPLHAWPKLPHADATAWAVAFKLQPDRAPARHPGRIWQEAGHAVLDALPAALAAAGQGSLAAFARADHPAENLAYRWRAARVPGARRWARHPTGRVRAASLAMLALRLGRGLPGNPGVARPFAGLVTAGGSDLDVATLVRLREVTYP